MIRKPISTSVNSYRHAAQDKFDALKKLYADSNGKSGGQKVSFWKLGNSFDTMIDFLDTIDDGSAQAVARMALAQFCDSREQLGGLDNAWFDDFGWWSIATQRALQKSFFKTHTSYIEEFKYILDGCWSRFTNNAPFVWQRHEPDPRLDNCAPAIDGGVWNAYWYGTSCIYAGPKDGDPTNGKLSGIQNTVTNALYLMAAQRLARTDTNARQAAQRELEFLRTWFKTEGALSLWLKLGPDAGLVRERVGHFKHKNDAAPGFEENWAWAGDQGLVLGCLSDTMIQTAPGFRGPLLAQAKALISGVCQGLVNNDHVVMNYTTKGSVPDNDVSDYKTGAGVFWRNALYVWNTNPELRAYLAEQEFQNVVRASADAARTDDEYSFEALTNQTAVLVAATAMLEKEDEA